MRGIGSDTIGRSRGTSIRRCSLVRSIACSRRPTTSSGARAAGRVTSSIWDTGFCRRLPLSMFRRSPVTCIRRRDDEKGGTFRTLRTPKSGVLLMAHGTPPTLDDLPEYLTLVRGGRPPSPELVAEMRRNYEAIGGRSPLTDITHAQTDALRARMGKDVPVAFGMRNWRPFIADALEELSAAGV